MTDSDLDQLAGFLAPILEARDVRVASRSRVAEAELWAGQVAKVEAEVERLKGSMGSANARVAALSLELERAKSIIRQLAQAGPLVIVDPPIVDPPMPPASDDGLAIIRAHDYLGRTAEQNLTIPRFDWLRANRAPRAENVGTFIYKANEVAKLENLDIKALWASCIGFSSDYPEHRQGPVTIRNVGHAMWPDAQQHTMWGQRGWSLSDVTRIDCDFDDMQEHGWYDNLSGSSINLRNTAAGLGGHTAYICLRNQPTLKPDGTWQYVPNNAVPIAPTTHVIEDCHSRNVCYSAAKGSDTITFFNAGTLEHQASIYIRDCTDIQCFPEQIHTGTGALLPVGATGARDYVRSFAAVTVKTYADQVPTGITGPHSHPIGLLSFGNCLWDFTQSNKELMNLNDCEKIVFDGCTFIARNHRQPVVKIDAQPGHAPTNEVVIANCASEGVTLHWTMPNGTIFQHTLDTRGRFMRLSRFQSTVSVENIQYDPAYRVTQMESASA